MLKEKLQNIVELNSEKISKMTDAQLSTYLKTLSVSSNNFPTQKQNLENAVQNMNHKSIQTWLTAVVSSLRRINADNMVIDLEKQISKNFDENVPQKKLQFFVDYLLNSVYMLYADIQVLLEEIELENNKTGGVTYLEKTKNKLLEITDLDSNKIKNKTTEQLETLLEDLTTFSEELLINEKGLKSSLEAKNYKSALQWLAALRGSLYKIHADSLAEDCQNQIDANMVTDNIRHERLELSINYILTSLDMLFEEIKALNIPKQEDNAGGTDKKINILSHGFNKKSKCILAINNDILFLKEINEILWDSGYKLIGATSALAAFDYLNTDAPDMFIFDDKLMGIGSGEITRKIRSAGHMVPILFTAGQTKRGDIVSGDEFGTVDIINKPLNPNEVKRLIATHM